MTARPSPPPPPGDLKPDSPWLQKWYWDVWKWVRGLAGAFNELDFTGSNLTSIQTRNHNDLQTIQGGTTTERYHLTAAQVALIGTASGFLTLTATKTSYYKASAGDNVACDSTGGAFTVEMPSNPARGALVGVFDSYQTFRSGNVTVSGSGAKLCGQDADIVLQENGQFVAFVYLDTARGWELMLVCALDNYPVSGTGAPTTTDILNGQDVIWNDTAGGTVKHYANVNGSLVSVTLS